MIRLVTLIPSPLILSTPNPLTNKRTHILGLYLLLGGWGCLILGRRDYLQLVYKWPGQGTISQ